MMPPSSRQNVGKNQRLCSSPPLARFVVMEDLLDSPIEVPGEGHREGKRWQVPPGLDRVDRLAGDAHGGGELTLREAQIESQRANDVLHGCKANLSSTRCQVSFPPTADPPLLDAGATPPVSSAVHERVGGSRPALAPRPTFDVVGGRLGTSYHFEVSGGASMASRPMNGSKARSQRGLLLALAAAMVLVIAACGGGGSKASSSAPAPAPQPAAEYDRDHALARLRRARGAGRGAEHGARLAEGPGRRVPGRRTRTSRST